MWMMMFLSGEPSSFAVPPDAMTPVGHISITSLSKHLMFHLCVRIKAAGEREEPWWPVVTLCALNWKKVSARAGCDEVFRQNNVTCLAETWLKHHTSLNVSGCLTISASRDEHRSVRSIWAGSGFSVGNNSEKPLCIFKQAAHQQLKSNLATHHNDHLHSQFGA